MVEVEIVVQTFSEPLPVKTLLYIDENNNSEMYQ
jgi:hypothetical protein